MARVTARTITMTALAVLAASAGAARAGGPDEDRPPYARPGECYEKVATAEVWETTPERRLVSPERVERYTVPAEWGWRDRTVVVRPARVERYPVPPVHRTVWETEVVRPATFTREVIPPVYETVVRQVLVREARTVWKPGRAMPAYGAAPAYAPYGYDGGWRGRTQVAPTGEIMCLVVEPAVYQTVTEQVLRVPERVIDHPVPAVTRQVPRQVVERPGYEATREIPAEYGSVREKYVVRPEREEARTIPPVYETVPNRHLVSPSRTEWRRIACAAPPPPPPPPLSPCAHPCGPPPAMHPPRPHLRPTAPVTRPQARVMRRRELAHRPPACLPCRLGAVEQGRPAAEASPPSRPAGKVHGRTMVSRLQRSLAERGYYKGAANGVNTPATHDALVRFQRDKGLSAQGQLTRETARALDLER